MIFRQSVLRPGLAAFVLVAFVALAARAENSGGYSGLVAPRQDALPAQNKPQGYGGLIPGSSRASTAPNVIENPVSTQQDSTPITSQRTRTTRSKGGRVPEPDFSGLGLPGVTTAAELAQAAARYGTVMRSKKNAPNITLPPDVLKALANPMTDEKGRTLQERMTKARVDQLLELATSENVAKGDRAALIEEIRGELTRMQESLYLRKNTPPDIYKNLGMNDAYIHNDRKGVLSSIAIVEQALGRF